MSGAPGSGSGVLAEILARAGLRFTGTVDSGGVNGDTIAQLHERALAEAGIRPWEVGTLRSVVGSELLRREAAGFLQSRPPRPWAWVDQRSVLLLDFWDRLLPDACWLFTIRSPAAHAWSWTRDARTRFAIRNPVSRLRAALRLWAEYNGRILEFARSRPERCWVGIVPRACTPQGLEALHSTLCTRWGFELRALTAEPVFVPQILGERTPRWVKLAAATSSARPVFHALRALSPLPHSAREARVAARPVLCVVTSQKSTYSETFIRAHIARLPARVEILHGRDHPSRTNGGFPVFTVFHRALLALEAELGFEIPGHRSLALSWFLKRRRVRAVLAEYGTNGARMYRACRWARVPLVVQFHGLDAYRSSNLGSHGRAYRAMFRTAAALVVVSREMERQLVRLGAPPAKIFYNPCGADLALFGAVGAQPEKAPPIFLAVGRFVEKKAPHLLLVAFRRAVAEAPAARLICVGDGPLLEPCRTLAGALGVEEAVSFPGPLPHCQVARLMGAARALIQFSATAADGDREGTPVSILEAGAAGLPVIASRHGGAPDVLIDGETGLLVPERDAGALSDAIVRLASDPDLAARLGRRAHEHVTAEHSLERRIGELWKILERAMQRNGGR